MKRNRLKYWISEADIQHLVDRGDTNAGYVDRGEYADMSSTPVEYVDCLILGRIRRLRKSSYSRINSW
jgi:hypothetical protein